jgi:hypothetical protein
MRLSYNFIHDYARYFYLFTFIYSGGGQEITGDGKSVQFLKPVGTSASKFSNFMQSIQSELFKFLEEDRALHQHHHLYPVDV